MRQLSTQDADFDSQLTELLAFETVNDADLLKTVDDIIAQVRHDGDRVVAQVAALTGQDHHAGVRKRHGPPKITCQRGGAGCASSSAACDASSSPSSCGAS